MRSRPCLLSRVPCSIAVTAAAAAASPLASGQMINAIFTQPSLDRWMYPFNTEPGTRPLASTFAALEIPGFDDRDAQFLIGFQTGSLVPSGRPATEYRIVSARVTAVVAVGEQFRYDPTFDSVSTSIGVTGGVSDSDPDVGKPVELFAAGYRNSWTALTFMETSPFGGMPVIPPAEGARNVFAALVDLAGNTTDISRQVRQRFEAAPMAIGLTDEVAPGNLVPVRTVLTFDVDLCDPATRAYLQRSLSEGRLNFVVSSLHPADGGPGGGIGDPAFPVFYTKENPLAQPPFNRAAQLHMTVAVGSAADFDGNGVVNVQDFLAFLTAYNGASPEADYTGDCVVNVQDFLAFLAAYSAG